MSNVGFPCESKFVDIYGSKMHYIEQGSGDPILFLHGVPASSYVWRNIIPHLSTLGRCIAVDLMGFGMSDKPEIEYSLDDHIKYLREFIKTLNLKNITLVMHDWGSIIGFDYAMHHEDNCKGLVFYEAYIRPINQEDFSLSVQEQFSLHEDNALDIIMNAQQFIDKVIPITMSKPLSNEELDNYRRPFLTSGSGKPLLKYLQEFPKENNKANQLIKEYSDKLQKSKIPKLMLYSIPGFITTIATVMWAKEHLSNLEIIEVGEALHFAQESNPVMMGEAISVWIQGIESISTRN